MEQVAEREKLQMETQISAELGSVSCSFMGSDFLEYMGSAKSLSSEKMCGNSPGGPMMTQHGNLC